MSDIKNQVSIGGLRANAVAFITAFSYFIGLGIIFPILILIFEPNNKFVKKYSKQTLAISVIAFLSLALNIILIIGTFLQIIIILVITIFQIIATINALLGKDFDIPYIDKITNILFFE